MKTGEDAASGVKMRLPFFRRMCYTHYACLSVFPK